MTWLVLQGGDRTLGTAGRLLEVRVRGDRVRTLAPESVDAVLLEGPVSVTPQARRLLLRAGCDVTYLDGRGRLLGRLVGSDTRGGRTRLAQAAAILDPERRVKLAACFVEGKLHNHYVALRRTQRAHPTEAGARALSTLRALRDRCTRTTDVAELMGVEGFGARTWFSTLGLALRNPEFTWAGRNRRPPRDPVNAVLSYVYTMLCAETDAAARRAGLDPSLGLLHETGRGKPACGLDLAEEWRPVVDLFVLGLFNRRQLSPGDFGNPTVRADAAGVPPEPDPEDDPDDPELDGDLDAEPPDPRPPVYLSASGRRIVLAAWAERLRTRLRDPLLDARFELREVLRLQARRLATAVRDGGLYTPYRWQ